MTGTSYAIQKQDPSGETYVVEYSEVNTITGISGPWHHREIDTILANAPSILDELEYSEDIPADWKWQAPSYVYDPVNGE